MTPIPPDPRDPPCADACVQCGEPRTIRAGREPHRATAKLDPFCSAECARAWYEVPCPSERYSTGISGKMSDA